MVVARVPNGSVLNSYPLAGVAVCSKVDVQFRPGVGLCGNVSHGEADAVDFVRRFGQPGHSLNKHEDRDADSLCEFT